MSGSWFSANPADEILVNTAYASTKKLKVGSTLTINGKTYKIVGLVSPTLTGNVSDIYFPLSTLQTLLVGRHVRERGPGLGRQVLGRGRGDRGHQGELPGAQVLTSKYARRPGDRAASPTPTSSPPTSAGRWPSSCCCAAFLIAALLTLSSVAKRVREIGSLRAIGWTRGAVVRQIMAETVGIGILGGILGVVLGVAVCAAVIGARPRPVGDLDRSRRRGVVAGLAHRAVDRPGTVTSIVHLTAPVSASTILIAFGCRHRRRAARRHPRRLASGSAGARLGPAGPRLMTDRTIRTNLRPERPTQS